MFPTRSIIAGATLVVLGCSAGATVAAAPPRAQLRDFVCQTALDPPARGVQVIAVIRPLPNTKQMQLRFQLLRKSKRHAGAVSGGDLGRWLSPADPTLGSEPGDVWNLKKQVINLPAPAEYRFRVSFRWLGAGGRVLGLTVKQAPTCTQPELRPDLQVRSITVQPVPGEPTENAYVALIRNGGRTGAGPFELRFTDGSTVVTRTVAWIGPHASRGEQFVGPACTAAGAPTVIADPGRVVDDYDRTNNSRTAVCPRSAGG
jgi:CARDB